MLRRLKDIYTRLGSAVRMGSRLSQHDRQLAQLGAAVAAVSTQMPGLDAKDREAAQAKLDEFLAYQGASTAEQERLSMLYESLAARIAQAEMEIDELRRKLPVTLTKPGGEVEDS